MRAVSKFERLLSFVLAVIMVFAMLPVGALAEATEETAPPSEEPVIKEEKKVETSEEPVIETSEEPKIENSEEPEIENTGEPEIKTSPETATSPALRGLQGKGGEDYVKRPCLVRFKDHNDVILKTQYVLQGKAATPPADPTREGYVFIGWDKDYTNVSDNMVVTAIYKIATYTVTFKNADAANTVLKEQEVEYNKDATPPADPTLEGHAFKGWDKSFKKIKADTVVTATYDINTYTVTFKDADGKQIGEKQTVNYGSAAKAPNVDVPEGKTSGWDTDFSNVKGDLEVKQVLTTKTYTVTFEDYDGTQIGETQTIEHGKDAAAPKDNPTREGYTFKEWDKAYTSIKADTVITAAYDINTYTVVFKDHDGKELSKQTVEHGSAAAAPADPEREGYTFTAWKPADFTSITADTEITATYSVNTYTVLFRDWDGEQLASLDVEYGNAATAPDDPEREGYVFTGWEPADFANITGPMTVTARYALNAGGQQEGAFTVTFKDWDNRVIDTQLVAAGDSAEEPVTPLRDGYKFTGWDKDFAKITEDLTVNAQYEALVIFFVKVNYRYEDGTIAHEPHLSTYKKGDAVQDQITSPVISGFTADKAAVDFTHVTAIDKDYTETVVYTPGDVGYTVKHFKQELDGSYTEVVADRETKTGKTGGTGEASPKSPAYEGYTCTTGDSSIMLGADADRNVINFYYERNSYLLTYNVDGGNYLAPVELRYGETIDAASFPTPERAGYIFDSWSAAPETMPAADVTVTARWKAGTASYTVIHMIQNTTGDGYIFESADIITNAKTESTIKLDENTLKQKGRISSDYRAYFTYAGCEYKPDNTVAGDGSTVVTVKYTRNSYTVVFKNSYGTTEYGRLSALYEADISNAWPYAGSQKVADWELSTNFRGWNVDGIDQMVVSKRLTMTGDLCDTSDNTKDAKAEYNASYTTDLHYMFEELTTDSSSSGYDEYNGKSYKENGTYSQTGVKTNDSAFGQKQISGYTKVGVEYSWRNKSYYDSYLYYDRDKYELTIYNGDTVIASYTGAKKIMFGASLEDYEPETEPTTPPAGKEGYVFAGWYTNIQAAGDEFEFSAAMPAGNLAVYAGWKKPTYEVTYDLNDQQEGTAGAVFTGTNPQEIEKGLTLAKPADPTRIGYTFLGWYKGDTRFIFDTQVHSDIALTAHWAVNTNVSYEVRYVYAEGEDKEGAVIEPKRVTGKTTGESVLENARAYFDEKTKALYLPNMISTTLTLTGDDTKDVITFEYRKANEAQYIIECLEEGTERQLRTPETITEKNIERGYITCNAPDIPGYTPKKYQATVYYGTTIKFYYTKNADVAYQVRYYLENLTDSGYTENKAERESHKGAIGSTVEVTAADRKSFTGFTFNPAASWESIRLGEVANANIIHLYFSRDAYTVTYKVAGDNGQLELNGAAMQEKVYEGVKHGTAWQDANATAPTPVPNVGFKATAWKPAFPAADAEVTKNYEFTVSFERDDSQYYKVTYYKNNEAAVGTMAVDDNGGAGYLKNTTYTVQASKFTSKTQNFTGWYTKPTVDGMGTAYAAGETFIITADTELYAQWADKATYSVVYHGNDDGDARPVAGATDMQNSTTDKPITISANGFTNPGWTFAGWNTAADGTGTPYAAEDEYRYDGTTAVLNLYAQWTKGARYAVVYNANWPDASAAADRSGVVPVDGNAYLAGENVTALGNTGSLALTGHNFLGWASDDDAEAAETIFTIPNPGEDITLYAVWAKINYNVRFLVDYLDGNSYVPYTYEELKTSYYYGDTLVMAQPPTKAEGYTFTHWSLSGAAAGAALPTTMGTSDLEFRGSFTLNAYDLKYWVAANGGTHTADYGENPDQIRGNVAFGTSLGDNLPGYSKTIPAGYHMSGWYMDKNRTTLVTTQTMPDQEANLYAALLPDTNVHYEFRHYTQPVVNGAAVPKTNLAAWKLEEREQFDNGTTDTDVTAEKKGYPGYTFDAAISDQLKQKVAGDGSLVINLYYAANPYTVTYREGDHGSLPGNEDSIVHSPVLFGEALPAAPAVTADERYTFTGWAPTNDDTPPYGEGIAVQGNYSYTAEYVPQVRLTLRYRLVGTEIAVGANEVVSWYDAGSEFPYASIAAMTLRGGVGSTYRYVANSLTMVSSGSAAAFDAAFLESEAGVGSEDGRIITLFYGYAPITSPTPSPAVTPTPGPTATPTPTATATNTPANTATPAPTDTPATVTDNPVPLSVGDDGTPLAAPQRSWALINLILMLLTALGSVLMLVFYFGRKQKEVKDDRTDEIRLFETKKHGFMRILSLVPAIGAIVAFILTEDVRLPMVLMDQWTLLMVAIAIIQAGVALLGKREDEEKETVKTVD